MSPVDVLAVSASLSVRRAWIEILTLSTCLTFPPSRSP